MCSSNMYITKIIFSLAEFMSCATVLILKKLFDRHAEQIKKINLKISYEWSLLSSITGLSGFDDFSLITFGGYTIITAIICYSRIFHRRNFKEKCEVLLFCFGSLLFAIEGSLLWLSIESVPEQLKVNGSILGGLCYFISLLFFIDVFTKQKDNSFIEKATQTDIRCRLETVQHKVFRNTAL